MGKVPTVALGYMHQEITLTTTILDSVVVAYGSPSLLEKYPVFNEVVGLQEAFWCICCDPGEHMIWLM
jgi:hypothetical protein